MVLLQFQFPFEKGLRPLEINNTHPRCSQKWFLISSLQLVHVLVAGMGGTVFYTNWEQGGGEFMPSLPSFTSMEVKP